MPTSTALDPGGLGVRAGRGRGPAAAGPQARPLASVSRLDVRLVAVEDGGELVGQVERQVDRVLDAQAGVLARELHGVHELAHEALLAQGVVERGLERDDAAAVALDLVALGRAGLDEEVLLGETELAPVGQRQTAAAPSPARSAATSAAASAAASASRTAPSCLPSRGPSTGRLGLTV